MNPPAIEVLEVRPVENAGNLRALAVVRIGSLTVRGWRIIQQPHQRAWVSVPQQQGRDGRWHNMLQVGNPALLEHIRAVVLRAWAEEAP